VADGGRDVRGGFAFAFEFDDLFVLFFGVELFGGLVVEQCHCVAPLNDCLETFKRHLIVEYYN